ncbi:hypothetical protein AAP_05972 [Ascosphaera apis ARSEF 7405]|uniref:F-box domain-containing protein n=1 Tax=Ascosphaera apis ARSEF 7405 TaxID=392613 RepID=A0A167V4A3_9EURO|nr:hypothetical protein AAP_05972 [Ascosphaera apis ARSEF 7405]
MSTPMEMPIPNFAQPSQRTLDTLPLEIICCIAEFLESTSYAATLAFSLTCHTTRTAMQKVRRRRGEVKPMEYNITDLLEIERWPCYSDPEGFSSWPDSKFNVAVSSISTCHAIGGGDNSDGKKTTVVASPMKFTEKSTSMPLVKGFLPAVYFQHCTPYRQHVRQPTPASSASNPSTSKPGHLHCQASKEKFACSLCLRIRHAAKFSPTMTDGTRGKSAFLVPDKDDRAYRFCIECGVKYGDYWVSDLFNIRWLPMCAGARNAGAMPVRTTMVV